MKPSHKLARRSFLVSVVGGVAAAGFLSSGASAQNTRYSGVTDCDSGANHDRPGYGTGNRNQFTDSDTGPQGDPRCRGRGPSARPEGSPSGTGRYSDTPTGCSDSDSGQSADPGGRGRTCNGGVPYPRRTEPGHTRHCSDSDRGNGADPLQQGRHC